MVKVGSGGSRVIVDSVRAPGRELELENTLFSRFVYLPDLESACIRVSLLQRYI